jgi:hypothetical protein
MVVPVRDGTIGMEGAAGRCDPTAKRLFRLLEERSEVDLLLVFNAVVSSGIELASGGGGKPDAARAAACAWCGESLAVATDELGARPSKRAYDQWRNAKPNPEQWASASSVLRILGQGRWQVATEALGGPRLDLVARRLLAQGSAFTPEECRTAMRLFCADVPETARSFSGYRSWALAHAQRPGARRVPAVGGVLMRRLGMRWSQLREEMAIGAV